MSLTLRSTLFIEGQSEPDHDANGTTKLEMLLREPERIKALRVVSYFGSIATSGSRFLGSGLRVPEGTRVISSTILSLNGVGTPTWRPCSET